jgi:hypothetical protein
MRDEELPSCVGDGLPPGPGRALVLRDPWRVARRDETTDSESHMPQQPGKAVMWLRACSFLSPPLSSMDRVTSERPSILLYWNFLCPHDGPPLLPAFSSVNSSKRLSESSDGLWQALSFFLTLRKEKKMQLQLSMIAVFHDEGLRSGFGMGSPLGAY